MRFLDIIKMVFNRRIWFLVCVLLCIFGTLMAANGTFNEVRQERISFKTNPRYAYELNTFFATQTINFIQDYTVSGYLYTPPIYYNLLHSDRDYKLPAIIFMHGMAASPEIQYNIPKALAMAGFKVLSIAHPGHDDSGGLWDMGIQTLAGVYSAVDYLKYMCWDVDSSKIGVSGHSMGGITTTRAGIFDNWTNPVTGNKIGTGGNITACGAIYSWDDMLNTILYSVSSFSDDVSPLLIYLPEEIKYTTIFSEPSINWLFRTWGWLGNNQPITVPYQMKARGVSNFINSTNIRNYCLITGWDDQLTNPLFQANIMENATRDTNNDPQEDAMAILRFCAGNLVWNYGNKTNGTARRLVMIPGTDHIREAFGEEVAFNLISWFHEAMNVTWDGGDPLYLLAPTYFSDMAQRVVGWIWLLIGAIGLIPVVTSYLSSWLKQKGVKNSEIASTYDKNQLIRRIIMYAAIFIGFGVLGISLFRFVFPATSFTRFWLWDLMNLFTLFSALFQLPAIIAIILFEWKKHGLHLQDLGLSLKSAIRGLAIGILAFLPTIAIYNPLAYSVNIPLMLPRPFEAEIYADFFILMGVLFLQAIVHELTFRGLIQTKMDRGGRKLKQWKTLLFGALISGIIIGLNFGIGMSIAFSTLINPIMFFLVFGILFLAFTAISILNGYLYQRTKSLITPIIISMLLLSFFEAGKLFLIYA
ncbi:MAG: alpha/beta fold hydrolase [Promethearchaeota archaeon]